MIHPNSGRRDQRCCLDRRRGEDPLLWCGRPDWRRTLDFTNGSPVHSSVATSTAAKCNLSLGMAHAGVRPAHQGMKSRSCDFMRRIRTGDSAMPTPRPERGTSPSPHVAFALHFPSPGRRRGAFDIFIRAGRICGFPHGPRRVLNPPLRCFSVQLRRRPNCRFDGAFTPIRLAAWYRVKCSASKLLSACSLWVSVTISIM